MCTDAIPSAPSGDAPIAIARQAIHDRWSRVVGYALLLRDPRGGEIADDEERAATRVIVETFTGIGVAAIAGEQPAHVRVTRRFLLELHALALPPERVVLEVADPGPDAALHAVLERLAAQRYRLSLVCDPHAPAPPALASFAESVKLDVRGLGDAQLADCVARFGRTGRTLMAAGVDTPSAQQRCRAAGFDRFQGFFLSTPDAVVAGGAPPSARVGELRTLAGLYAHSTFEQLEETIAGDLGLSYRLLTYLNSAWFNLPRRVASVREALVLLGTQAVRRWATLIVLSDVPDAPHELTVTALVRARMCELIGRRLPQGDPPPEPEAFFTVGLFSVVDALAQAPLEQAIETLPLTDEARAALLDRRGPMGVALAATLAYERGELDAVARLLPGVPASDVYLEAVGWADATSGVLRATTRTSADTTSGEN